MLSESINMLFTSRPQKVKEFSFMSSFNALGFDNQPIIGHQRLINPWVALKALKSSHTFFPEIIWYIGFKFGKISNSAMLFQYSVLYSWLTD